MSILNDKIQFESIPQIKDTISIPCSEELDKNSGLSFVYLTSVYHDDLNELKKIAQKERDLIDNNNIDEEKGIGENDELNKNELLLNENETKQVKENEKDIKLSRVNEPKPLLNVYLYSILIASLSSILQVSILILLFIEYFPNKIIATNNHYLITMRIVCALVTALKIWIYLSNGRHIILHGIYHRYLYRTNTKRIVTCLFAFIQIIIGFFIYFAACLIFSISDSTMNCFIHFAAFIIVIDIDSWIGNYFITKSNSLKRYSRNSILLYYIIDKRKFSKYKIGDFIIDAMYLITFIISIVPVFKSIIFG